MICYIQHIISDAKAPWNNLHTADTKYPWNEMLSTNFKCTTFKIDILFTIFLEYKMATYNLHLKVIINYLNKINQDNVVLTIGEIWTESVVRDLLKYYGTYAKVQKTNGKIIALRINIASFINGSVYNQNDFVVFT